jgi:hypothetical protein
MGASGSQVLNYQYCPLLISLLLTGNALLNPIDHCSPAECFALDFDSPNALLSLSRIKQAETVRVVPTFVGIKPYAIRVPRCFQILPLLSTVCKYLFMVQMPAA